MSTAKVDHSTLDTYLATVFALIEGGHDISAAQRRLSNYLADPGQQLSSDGEQMLMELFFDKCAREWVPEREL